MGPFKHFNRKHLASVRSFHTRVCQNASATIYYYFNQSKSNFAGLLFCDWLKQYIVGAQKFILLWHSFRLSYDSMIMHKIDFFRLYYRALLSKHPLSKHILPLFCGFKLSSKLQRKKNYSTVSPSFQSIKFPLGVVDIGTHTN